MVVAGVVVVGGVRVVVGGGGGGVGVDVGHWCSGLFEVWVEHVASAVVICFGFDGFEKFGRRWH